MEASQQKPAKRRIFFDMDGVLADFDKLRAQMNVTGDEMKRMPGAFAQLEPIDGALAGVRSCIGMGYEVWIATKPPTGVAQAYADKAAWIMQHLPELSRRIIVTHHKGMLGGDDDFLVDDRPHKAKCTEFRGELVHFGPEGTIGDWAGLVELFRQRAKQVDARLSAGLAEYRPAADTVINFDAFVQHGRDQGVPIVNGMPWSFTYKGHAVVVGNDQCYLILLHPPVGSSGPHTLRFTPGDLLITDNDGRDAEGIHVVPAAEVAQHPF